MAPDERKRILDLVNDACGQRADRRHAFCQQQPLLKLALRRHVDDRGDGTFEPSLAVLDEPPVYANVPWLSRAAHDRGFEMDVPLFAEGRHQYAQEIGLGLGGQQLERAANALFRACGAN